MKKITMTNLFLVLYLLYFFSTSAYAAVSQATDLQLSSDERHYLQTKKTLKVSLISDWKPFSYQINKNTYQGLPIMILERLTQGSGTSLQIIPAQSYSQSLEQLASGKADLMGMLIRYPTDQQNEWQGKRLNSQPYLRLQTMLIHHKNVNISTLSTKTLADIKGRYGFTPNQKIPTIFYDTLPDCMNAVRSGQTDITICDIFTGSAMMQQYTAKDLVSVPTTVMLELGFGFLPETDAKLVSALQKTVNSFSEKEINYSLFQGNENKKASLLEFVYRYPFEIICFQLAIMFVLTLGLLTYTKIRIRQHQTLQDYEESYRLLSDTFGEAGMEYDYLNDTLTIFGKKSNLDIDQKVDDFKEKLKHNAIRIALTIDEFDRILREGVENQSFSTEFQCGIKSGEWIWYRLIYTVICTTESHHRPIRLIGCLANIEAEHAEKEKLLKLSSSDPLTGLFNRATGEKHIRSRLEQKLTFGQGMLVLVDLDYFKNFNDQLGHLCGDDVLRTFGEVARETFSPQDILCRWGGDEFLFFLMQPEEQIDLLCKKMRVYQYQGLNYPVTLSIGGAISHTDCTLESLFQQADEALYLAKKNGRNQFQLYNPNDKTANI